MDKAVSAPATGASDAEILRDGTIVAGMGCRAGVDASQVLAVLDAALAPFSLSRNALAALATIPRKQGEPALAEAARTLGLPLLVPGMPALAQVSTPTRSPASLAATGFGSAAEAAALAAAGQGARLLGARTVAGSVTCALAVKDGKAP